MILNTSLIKETRISKGWTQAQLAELCAVNVRTIQRVESDATASLETTMALASAFEIETKDLFADPKIKKKNSYKTTYIVLGLLAGFICGLTVLAKDCADNFIYKIEDAFECSNYFEYYTDEELYGDEKQSKEMNFTYSNKELFEYDFRMMLLEFFNVLESEEDLKIDKELLTTQLAVYRLSV